MSEQDQEQEWNAAVGQKEYDVCGCDDTDSLWEKDYDELMSNGKDEMKVTDILKR